MTDQGEKLATLEQNQRDRLRDAELSKRVKMRLENVRSLLEVDNGNGPATNGPVTNGSVTNGSTDPVYAEIRQGLERVRQIARDLREGRY